MDQPIEDSVPVGDIEDIPSPGCNTMPLSFKIHHGALAGRLSSLSPRSRSVGLSPAASNGRASAGSRVPLIEPRNSGRLMEASAVASGHRGEPSSAFPIVATRSAVSWRAVAPAKKRCSSVPPML